MKKDRKRLLIWGGFAVALITSLIAEHFVEIKPVAIIDSRPFFHAWFGFGSCVIMILFAKILGLFLKRGEGYYKEGNDE
jgi:hypothetical protein